MKGWIQIDKALPVGYRRVCALYRNKKTLCSMEVTVSSIEIRWYSKHVVNGAIPERNNVLMAYREIDEGITRGFEELNDLGRFNG